LYCASPERSTGALQPLFRLNYSGPSVLQSLWGSAPSNLWCCRNQDGQEACCWPDMTNIYLVSTCHMYQLSKLCFSRVHDVSPALAFICTCWCLGLFQLSCSMNFLVRPKLNFLSRSDARESFKIEYIVRFIVGSICRQFCSCLCACIIRIWFWLIHWLSFSVVNFEGQVC
jgi:hypothetical protein